MRAWPYVEADDGPMGTPGKARRLQAVARVIAGVERQHHRVADTRVDPVQLVLEVGPVTAQLHQGDHRAEVLPELRVPDIRGELLEELVPRAPVLGSHLDALQLLKHARGEPLV